MTIQTRKAKINTTEVREIYRRDNKHRVYSVKSPTSDKPYQVITDWSIADSIITINCKLYSFEVRYFQFKHPANYSKQICCQFLASVKWAAKQAGMTLSLPRDGEFASAVKLLNLGGQLIKITNQNDKSVWGVVR